MKFPRLVYRGGVTFLLMLSIFFSNCAVQSHLNSRNDSTTKALEPSPSQAEVPEYRLGYGDVIQIKFFNNPMFNEEVIVRPDGRISLEKAGDIFVAGMTPKQLSEQITKIYSKIINNPEVTVIVRQFGGHSVYVLGEVNLPGGYPIQRDMNFLHALALAGGPKNTANLKSVVILRREKSGNLNAFKVDLNNPAHFARGQIYPTEFAVQPLDIIYVPKTFISNINTFLRQIYDGVLPPLDVYLRALWWTDR